MFCRLEAADSTLEIQVIENWPWVSYTLPNRIEYSTERTLSAKAAQSEKHTAGIQAVEQNVLSRTY